MKTIKELLKNAKDNNEHVTCAIDVLANYIEENEEIFENDKTLVCVKNDLEFALILLEEFESINN